MASYSLVFNALGHMLMALLPNVPVAGILGSMFIMLFFMFAGFFIVSGSDGSTTRRHLYQLVFLRACFRWSTTRRLAVSPSHLHQLVFRRACFTAFPVDPDGLALALLGEPSCARIPRCVRPCEHPSARGCRRTQLTNS